MARRRRAGPTISLTAALMLGGGCAEDGAVGVDAGTVDGGWDTICGPNLKPRGPACVPILDDCPDNHVPVPGGGCKRVGVEECSIDGVTGIVGPPDWTCKRIGVVECTTTDGGPGLKGPPDWTCKAIGPPTKCLVGWAKTSDGWCEPVLPKAKCPAGTMEVIGKATCQPVGDCGTGKWGKIQLTAGTVFVDASYSGKGADGSQAKPFATIGQALKAAPKNARIAVAAGEYNEDVVLDKARVLEGRCAANVRIVGKDPQSAAVTVLHDVTLRGLGVTGPGRGIWIRTGKARVESVEVARTGSVGVDVRRAAGLTLRDSLVTETNHDGIRVAGTAGLVERCAVRDTKPLDKSGRGIVVYTWEGQPASLTLRDSVVARNHLRGLEVSGATATVERSVVRDTQPRVSDNQGGDGISVVEWEGQPASLLLRDSIVARNHYSGLIVAGATATVERSVVRETQPQASDNMWGEGIVVTQWEGAASSLALRDSIVASNHLIGIQVLDATATIERSLVQDTQPQASDNGYGHGITVQPGFEPGGQPASLALRDSVVAENHCVGVLLAGATGTAERSVVRDTRPQVSDKALGTGIQALDADGLPAKLELKDCLIHNNRLLGVGATNADLNVKTSVVRDTQNGLDPEQDFEAGVGVNVSNTEPHKLSIQDTLVAGSRYHGIAVFNSTDAVLRRCVVRETREAKSGRGGGGIALGSPSLASKPLTAELSDSLVQDNTGYGVRSYKAHVVIRGSVIKETRSWLDKSFGHETSAGVFVNNAGTPRNVLLQDVLATANQFTAIWVFDTPEATLERCAVRDTGPNAGNGIGGTGISAVSYQHPSKLSLVDSVLQRNRVAGMLVQGTSATVRRCLVQGTSAGKQLVVPAAGTAWTTVDGWGEGLFVGNYHGSALRGALALEDTLVEDSGRAGVLYAGTSGSIHRSVLRNGMFSVVLDAAQVELGEDNLFEENTEDRVTYTEDLPAVAPIPVPPPPEPPPTR